MIIWINGAFGVGKTQTVNELARRLANTFLFDPEEVGFFLRKYLPNSAQFADFQQHPLWRKQVLEDLLFCEHQNVNTIVPMTIVDDDIFNFIIGGIRASGVDIRHFALMASKATIENRLIERGDGGAWCFDQVERCLSALNNPQYAKHIDTESNNLNKVVELIIANL